ncbi:hypothetical protein [Nonomuraea polychroma]|uniref:hypothetical protein n=1 Tax=Nonomuraea polychroma TaxID=46176 RepID=UPI0013E3954F|nr:hypothetical protein [Nonomuraea polychroma]
MVALDALPVRPARLYVDGLHPVVVGGAAEIVDDPRDADLIVVRIAAPWEARETCMLETGRRDGCRSTAHARWTRSRGASRTFLGTPPTHCSAPDTLPAHSRDHPDLR